VRFWRSTGFLRQLKNCRRRGKWLRRTRATAFFVADVYISVCGKVRQALGSNCKQGRALSRWKAHRRMQYSIARRSGCRGNSLEVPRCYGLAHSKLNMASRSYEGQGLPHGEVSLRSLGLRSIGLLLPEIFIRGGSLNPSVIARNDCGATPVTGAKHPLASRARGSSSRPGMRPNPEGAALSFCCSHGCRVKWPASCPMCRRAILCRPLR